MKTARIYTFFILLSATGFSYAQGIRNAPISLGFADSVRIVLENTRKLDAAVVGTGFISAWSRLGLDQQQIIQKQTALMRQKKIPLRPHLINYFGAIVNAASIEQASEAKLTGFLKVAGKVIETCPPQKIFNFLSVSRTFFQYHALHYEKTFRLYVRDDEYDFDFIEPPPPVSWDDAEPSETDSMDNDWSDDTASSDDYYADDYYTEQAADSTPEEEIMPAWMTPEPPPYIEGPVIRFHQATLNFVTAYDSVFLKNTKGTLSLTDNIFVGEGGTFDWSPAGLHPDSVYCAFTQYYFNTSKAELNIPLVKLNYVGKTPGFIPGTFEFRSQSRPDSVASTYPRFKSYQSNLSITGLARENVQYRGGFSLIGSRISSASVMGDDAVIEVYRNDLKKFTARAANFIFNPTSIEATKAKVSILHGFDSIIHQAVNMKYSFVTDSTQQLVLRKDEGPMRNAPYSSSFFNIDFSADVLRWNLMTDSLDIQIDGGRNTVPVIIESTDYYDPEDYRLLKGRGFRFHPLALVVSYSLKNNIRTFYSGDLAMSTNTDPMEIKKAIEFLYQKGLVIYNARTDLIQVTQRAIDLYLANKGEEDYDNLKIHSVIDSLPNVTINFGEQYMTVRGVEGFSVSDSLNVYIQPDSATIRLLKNRDIKFDGTITAGNFEINGKGFTLKYDSFYIDLAQIDSINFYILEKNARGYEGRSKVNNSLVGADSIAAMAGGLGDISISSGTLYISKANNKSGKISVPNYPRLDASTGGVIYFDRKSILGGAYDRSVFFVVPPFKLDSLNDADPASINFDGTFVSGGIFPNFKEKLRTHADKSMGFEHNIPPEGYPLYGGDANMHGRLRMDNNGLRGNGLIDYLAAQVRSSDFIFYQDSTVGQGDLATISEKQIGDVWFPQATLPEYDMKWLPREGKMRLRNRNVPFNFYDSTAQMQGIVTISKNGVEGYGKLETRGTELISRNMKFSAHDFSARRARFNVKSNDPDKNLLTGNDVRLRFNLSENYADISPEIEGVAAIDFPYAQFKTSIPNARWDLNEQKIIMSKSPDVPLENSYFYTTRKDLDSLSFNAERAEYDLKTQQLKVSGIPHIIVADAEITPENNEVLILENAKIGTLKNTTIVVDTLNGYHRLTDGVVDIISRKEFRGYATYQYVNFLNDTFSIKMTNFHLEPIQQSERSRRFGRSAGPTFQTVASGSVTEKDSIVLGAGMYYKGTMTMYATRPALELNGYVKLDIRKIKKYNTWIQYHQTGEETDVMIDFDNALTEGGKRVNAGLHFNSENNDLYYSFLNEKHNDTDEDFFLPSGALFFDHETNEYKIEDREKAMGNKLSGKVFSYNDQTMHTVFEGPVNFFKGNKGFSIEATAIGSGNFETNEIRMNTFMIINSNVPSTAFDLMARKIQDVIANEGAPEGLGDHTELLYKIADILGESAVRSYEEKSLQGYVPLTTLSAMVKPLVFADVNLKWSHEAKAFYSEGLLGLSNIGRNDINGAFEGFMEIRKNEDGTPVFHVFIKASPEAWYYFGFEDNRMLVHSSDTEFNTIISKKTNVRKAKVGEVAFLPGSDDETLAFINRFRKQYYGIEVPYNLYEGTANVPRKKEEVKEDDGF